MRPEDFELELEELSDSCRRTGAALRELREEVNGLEAATVITDNDRNTVQAMEFCISDPFDRCNHCPYEKKNDETHYCVNGVLEDALDLIWRLSVGKLGKKKDVDPARVIEALELCPLELRPMNPSEQRCDDLCPYYCNGCIDELRRDAAKLLRKAYPWDGE